MQLDICKQFNAKFKKIANINYFTKPQVFKCCFKYLKSSLEIKSVYKAKYLGITFDNRLNFHEHIKILETKIARSVGILNKLKYFLPSSALLKLYYSLIHSHFNYGLVVWGSIYLTYLSKIKFLQNKAIRIFTSSHMSTNSKLLHIKTNILLSLKLLEFETAKIVYSYNFNLLSKIFDNYSIFHMLNLAILVPQDFH